MGAEVLREWTLILAFIVIAGYLFQKIKLPPMIGFLIPGILLGPYGFGLVTDRHGIEALAEMGVIFLLFTIGIEFSIRHLLSIRRTVLLGGGLQVTITAAAIYFLGTAIGLPFRQALFFGLMLSLSSTAIVLKILLDRDEMETPQGRLTFGILIFQDLAIVPFMLLVPFLGASGITAASIGIVLGKAFIILAGLLLVGRYVIPHILNLIVRTHNQELFLLTVIFLCLATVWGTAQAGLSFALGAFVAGLIISQSEYSHQALALLLPFRDTLLSFFFVSIGMMLNIKNAIAHPFTVLGFALLIILTKALIVAGIAAAMRYSSRIAFLTALSLAQVGEFSFILSIEGMGYGLLSPELQQLFITASVITMALTPLLINAGGRLCQVLNTKGLFQALDKKRTAKLQPPGKEVPENHVIIAGFGLNGRNVARILRQKCIPYIILEIDPEIVDKYKKEGEPIIFGDATHKKLLLLSGIKQARTMVVGVSAPVTRRLIIKTASALNPSLHIIVRTRYLKDRDELLKLGAHEVISEEFETSLEILARVLHSYFIPYNTIQALTDELREGTYTKLREISSGSLNFRWETYLSELQIEPYEIEPGSRADNKSIGELALRTKYGVTIIAVRRGTEIFPNPGADFILQMGDTVVMVGKNEEIAKAQEVFA